VLIVTAWGWFLIQGVRDPDGGVKALWPIFGIANQMLASIALCLATTVILKMQLAKEKPRTVYALVALLPLLWLLTVTLTAAGEKIFHSDPRIGFLAQAKVIEGKLPALRDAAATGNAIAHKAVLANEMMLFNNILDAIVTGSFIVMVALILLFSAREWILLLARKRLSVLRETDPVWLPDYEFAAEKPLHVLGLFALLFALAKELSGEAALERARTQTVLVCECGTAEHQQLYVAMTTRRFKGVNRCC